MPFNLPELPYSLNALMPHLSEETLEYHHGKHHKAYVDNLNKLITGTGFETMSLEEIIRNSSGGVFNNAAQAWNHTFYWHSLSPNGGGTPKGVVLEAIEKQFGHFDKFKEAFSQKAITQFGSGWAWLVLHKDGSLEVTSTGNAETPLQNPNVTPLLTCDVWEHAYYIDYRNQRPKYVEHFFELINWEFVERNMKAS